MKVLLAYRSDVDLKGGAALMMQDLQAGLVELGLEVDVSVDQYPDVSGYDLVHVINMWTPPTALDQLRYLAEKNVPVALTPIYSHWAEVAWARPAVLGIYRLPDGPERRHYLERFAAGELSLENGFTRWRFNEIVPGFHGMAREMVDLVDHLFVFSNREMQALMQVTRLVSKPYTVVPHGVVADVVRDASPEAFREHTGIAGEFVLTVGTLNGHKNQLLLVEALKGTGLKLVLVGSAVHEPEYRELCLREGGDGVVHLDFLPREIVASAYKAAAVHAQTSFAEGAAQVNFEAAVAGCPIVVSNRSSELEYFGDRAWYCDPTDPDSIRRAVLAARGARTREPERLAASAEIAGAQTWLRAAETVAGGYRRTRASFVRRVAAQARAALGVETRAATVLALLEELEREPSLLADYVRAVAPDAPQTLLISAGEADDAALKARAASLAAAAALPEDCADVVVFRPGAAPLERAVDFVYGEAASALLPETPTLELGGSNSMGAPFRETPERGSPTGEPRS